MSVYSLGVTGEAGRIRLDDLAAYAERVGRCDIAADLRSFAERGCRYSYEDFDVQSRAWSELKWPSSACISQTLKDIHISREIGSADGGISVAQSGAA